MLQHKPEQVFFRNPTILRSRNPVSTQASRIEPFAHRDRHHATELRYFAGGENRFRIFHSLLNLFVNRASVHPRLLSTQHNSNCRLQITGPPLQWFCSEMSMLSRHPSQERQRVIQQAQLLEQVAMCCPGIGGVMLAASHVAKFRISQDCSACLTVTR